MAPERRAEYRVQVTPVETGYGLTVQGIGQFMVSDGHDESLEQVARELIAVEVQMPADAIAVVLRYVLMDRFRRPSPFSWPILLLGLATLLACATSFVLEEPALSSVAHGGLLGLVVARLVGTGTLSSAAYGR